MDFYYSIKNVDFIHIVNNSNKVASQTLTYAGVVQY